MADLTCARQQGIGDLGVYRGRRPGWNAGLEGRVCPVADAYCRMFGEWDGRVEPEWRCRRTGMGMSSTLRGVVGLGMAGQGGLSGFRRLRTAGLGGMSGVRRFGRLTVVDSVISRDSARCAILNCAESGLGSGYGNCLGVDRG